MPKLQTIDGKTRHYAYTPEGKKAYERDKAAMQMSPTAKLGTLDVDGGTSGGGGGTYTPPKQKPRTIPSSRMNYANTPKPSKTKTKGERKVKPMMTAKEYMEKMELRKNIRKGKQRTYKK